MSVRMPEEMEIEKHEEIKQRGRIHLFLSECLVYFDIGLLEIFPKLHYSFRWRKKFKNYKILSPHNFLK